MGGLLLYEDLITCVLLSIECSSELFVTESGYTRGVTRIFGKGAQKFKPKSRPQILLHVCGLQMLFKGHHSKRSRGHKYKNYNCSNREKNNKTFSHKQC